MSDKTELSAKRLEFEVWARDECRMPPDAPLNWNAVWTKAAWDGWLAARRATIQPTAAEPVAEICGVWELRFVGSGPIATIVEHHGLKIGDKLYAHPPVAPADAVRDAERWIAVADRLPEPGTEVLINGSEGVEVALLRGARGSDRRYGVRCRLVGL